MHVKVLIPFFRVINCIKFKHYIEKGDNCNWTPFNSCDNDNIANLDGNSNCKSILTRSSSIEFMEIHISELFYLVMIIVLQ